MRSKAGPSPKAGEQQRSGSSYVRGVGCRWPGHAGTRVCAVDGAGGSRWERLLPPLSSAALALCRSASHLFISFFDSCS